MSGNCHAYVFLLLVDQRYENMRQSVQRKISIFSTVIRVLTRHPGRLPYGGR